MRERSTRPEARGAPDGHKIGAAYRLGPLIRADRESRLHTLEPVESGAPAAVAKIARRERRAALRAALRAEGELLSQVRHPNVVQCYEVGESDEAGAFLIREPIVGSDLGTYLRAAGALSAKRSREITGALVGAIRSLEKAGVTVSVDPADVWIEEGTERVVVVSATPTPLGADARHENGPNAIADVMIACTRGRLAVDEKVRARARVEVLQARRSGAPLADIPEEVGDVVEACVVRRAGGVSVWDEIEARLDGAASDGASEPGATECRGRASEIEGLLRASLELDVRRDELPLPSNLPRLLEQAGRGVKEGSSKGWPELEAALTSVADDLSAVLAKVVQDRAAALESEWSGFERAAGPFLTEPEAESFVSAVEAVRGNVAGARFRDASTSLRRADEALSEARAASKGVAEQHTRNEVDVLVRELDELEASYPDVELDPTLEPRRVRAEVQDLVAEGRLVEALDHVKQAVESVSGERAVYEKAALHTKARALAERAVEFRRNPAGPGSDAAEALEGVEGRLAEMVALLGRGALADARAVSEEVGAELKRLDWERELVASDSDVSGLAELDDVRRTAGRLQRGEAGSELRRELVRALDRLEQATHGVWADALTRLREVVDRSAWGSLAAALSELRDQMVRTATPQAQGDVSFQPSPEMAEVLRILAEAERDSPPASDPEAARLRELRARGEILLAGLDPAHARDVAPEVVDRLVEHCAAAAEAERRGEHGRAIEELQAANAALADLLAATAPPAGAAAEDRGPGPEVAERSRRSEPAPEPDTEIGDVSAPVEAAAKAETSEPGLAMERETELVVAPEEPRTRGWGAFSSVDRRAYVGLILALAAVAWWMWAPSDWWATPVAGRRGPAGVGGAPLPSRPTPPSRLFPRIVASQPAGETLRRSDLPSRLSVAIGTDGVRERPAIVWWLGDRVVGRTGSTLDLSKFSPATFAGGASLRVIVGEGTREQQMRVWRFAD